VIIVLRAVHTPRSFNLSHPVKILPEVAVPRQGLKQVEFNLPVLAVHPDVQVSDETKGSTTRPSVPPSHSCSQNCMVNVAKVQPKLLSMSLALLLAAGKIIRLCERVEGKDSYHNQALFSAGLPARVYHS
ncbi:hypothetical protein J6590_100840, partial [Homalodisca vitripennis]